MSALLRAAPLALALAAGVAACTGSGSSGAPVAPITGPGATPTPTPTPAPGATATPTPTASPTPTATPTPTPTPVPVAAFGLSFTVRTGAGSSAARAPQYVSQGTQSVAAYDGSTLIYVGNVVQGSPPTISTVYAKVGTTTVTGGSCVNGSGSTTCTISLTTNPGAHLFDVITYPVPQGQLQAPSLRRNPKDVGTVPAFNGVILAEGELAVTLVAGTNPPQTIVPLGVADRVIFTGPVLTQHLNGTGPLVGVIGTTYTFTYTVNDSATVQAGGFQIVTPGDYDNGPVTIAETDGGGIVTMTAVSQGTPPANTGPQSFTVTCAANGTATITGSAKTKPNATYASALTYTPSNYPTATLGTTTLQCVPNSATLPVTVQ